MSNIPLDLERRLEQRWAATRFSRPLPSATSHEREKQGQQSAEPERAKMKTRPTEVVGLKSVAAAACERGA
jgi:hypothetical protein